jgi:hypothetical protein
MGIHTRRIDNSWPEYITIKKRRYVYGKMSFLEMAEYLGIVEI